MSVETILAMIFAGYVLGGVVTTFVFGWIEGDYMCRGDALAAAAFWPFAVLAWSAEFVLKLGNRTRHEWERKRDARKERLEP